MPAQIYVDPHGATGPDGTEWVFMTRRDWAQVGGYIYSAQQYLRAAGPCLGRNRESKSDVPHAGTGAVGK